MRLLRLEGQFESLVHRWHLVREYFALVLTYQSLCHIIMIQEVHNLFLFTKRIMLMIVLFQSRLIHLEVDLLVSVLTWN